MSLVKEWFAVWKRRHIEVVHRHDWPALESEYWNPWFRSLIAAKASQPACNAASDQMALERHPYLDGQLKAFLAILKSIRLETGNASMLSREDVILASQGCDWCSGSGLAVVVRRDRESFAIVTPTGIQIQKPEAVMACVCQHGRWLLSKHSKPPWLDLALYQAEVKIRHSELIGAPVEDSKWGSFAAWREAIAKRSKLPVEHVPPRPKLFRALADASPSTN